MNKEELLKIYSAYLPYNLNVQLSAKDTYKNGVFPLIGIRNDGLFYMGESGMFGYVQRELGAVKPILYDLSYLTKEELISAGFKDHIDYLTHEREGWIEKYGFDNYIKKLPYGHFQYLVSQHYNVFNLPESEFINKAT